jgi:hypothetical protein
MEIMRHKKFSWSTMCETSSITLSYKLTNNIIMFRSPGYTYNGNRDTVVNIVSNESSGSINRNDFFLIDTQCPPTTACGTLYLSDIQEISHTDHQPILTIM